MHALLFPMTKENCLLQKRFLVSAYEMLFSFLWSFSPTFSFIPFCKNKVLSTNKKVNWNMKEIWQFFFVHLYVPQCRDFGKNKTKLGADFSLFYSTWENCVNWIFLKFSSHLFPIFFIILSLRVLEMKAAFRYRNWPCSSNWFWGWKYKKEATKKHCLKNIFTQIERKLVLTLKVASVKLSSIKTYRPIFLFIYTTRKKQEIWLNEKMIGIFLIKSSFSLSSLHFLFNLLFPVQVS